MEIVPDRFDRAIQAMDASNSQDPKRTQFGGLDGPRELIFARRVYDWVIRLDPSAGEALLLAARGHTLRRWDVPRSSYPMNKIGYRDWRNACAKHHAQVAEKILKEQGFEESTINEVSRLILKEDWPALPGARALEDADCLAFLEMKLAEYLDEWGEAKTVNILRKTLRKMTAEAITLAASIALDARSAELLAQASRE